MSNNDANNNNNNNNNSGQPPQIVRNTWQEIAKHLDPEGCRHAVSSE